MNKHTIDKGIRASNFAIDVLAVLILTGIIQVVFYSANLFYWVYFIYCLLMEAVWGQTLGKMISGTRVVDYSGGKPSFGRILWRSILRLYPFDLMSFVFGYEYGAHDRLSRTKIIFKNIS